jgi:hypothetical protein
MTTPKTRRPGRPKKPPTVSVTFNISPELKQSLDEAAKGRGLGLSEYIRLQVFGFAETRMENGPFEGVTITRGPEFPATWEEFEQRTAQRFVTLYQTVETWRQHLDDENKARELGLGSTYELYAFQGKLLGFDDPNMTPMERVEAARQYMRNQSEKAE